MSTASVGTVTSTGRDDLLDDRLACVDCGYIGHNLIEFDSETPRFRCVECNFYNDPSAYSSDFVIAWLPQYSKSFVSSASKIASLVLAPEFFSVLSEISSASDPKLRIAEVETALSSFQEKGLEIADAIEIIDEEAQRLAKSVASEFQAGINAAKDLLGDIPVLDAFDVMASLTQEEQSFLQNGIRLIPKMVSAGALNKTDRIILIKSIIRYFIKTLDVGLDVKQSTEREDIIIDTEAPEIDPGLASMINDMIADSKES